MSPSDTSWVVKPYTFLLRASSAILEESGQCREKAKRNLTSRRRRASPGKDDIAVRTIVDLPDEQIRALDAYSKKYGDFPIGDPGIRVPYQI